MGLVACQPRPWRPTTTVAGDAAATPDLLLRDFTCDTPATKLVGDITYTKTWEGWLYLATVLDCHTKQVLGYAMADHLKTTLVTDALAMAARTITIRPQITIFHSDRLNSPSTPHKNSLNTPTSSASAARWAAPEPVITMPGPDRSTAP